MFLAERGCDRYNVAGGESVLMQNRTILSQNRRMKDYFSEDAVSSTNVNIGDCIFSLQDDWRKNGTPLVQDTTAQFHNFEYRATPPGDNADPNMHEEWWGLRNAYWTPMPAYFTMQAEWAAPPSHFRIVHDGTGQESQPEPLAVYAMDKWNFPVINYKGTISLFTRSSAAPGLILWYNDAANLGRFTNLGNGTARYTFSSNDRGLARFYIVDPTVESIQVEVMSRVTMRTDDDTDGWLRFEAGPASVEVVKSLVAVNIGAIGTNRSIPASKPRPGSTVTWKVRYTNTGLGTAMAPRIVEDVPFWGSYLPNSMKFSVSGGATYAQAVYRTDAGGDDPASALGSRLTLLPNAGISPSVNGTIPSKTGGVFYFRTVLGNHPAGMVFNNIAFATGQNFPRIATPTVGTQMSTNFGGRFSFVPDISNTPQPTYFPVMLTNKGNLSTSYTVSLTNLTSNIALGNWSVTLVSNHNDNPVMLVRDLPTEAFFSFRIRVAPGTVSLNDWVQFRLKARAGNNTTATCYMGDDGITYGGDIGRDWTGAGGKNPGVVFQQENPEIRFTITTVPLRVTAMSPLPRATASGLYAEVVLTFNNLLNAGTVNSSSVILRDSDWRTAPVLGYAVSGNQITVTAPATGWHPNEFYTVTLTTDLKDSMGGSLTGRTNLNFYTPPGNETLHRYRTPVFQNNTFADWSTTFTNNCFYMSNLRPAGEQVSFDAANTLKSNIKALRVTWDATYLYIAFTNAASQALCATGPNSWWVYLAIDTTRDDQGATISPENKSLRTFTSNRKPEIFMYFPHIRAGSGNASYDRAQAIRFNNAFLRYTWNGSSWSGGASMGRGGLAASSVTNFAWTPRGGYTGQSTGEIRVKWSDIGTVPNRAALSAWIASGSLAAPYNISNKSPLDFSPDRTAGDPSTWVTIDCDNNGDGIPDKATSFSAARFTIWHDGAGTEGVWEPIVVSARDMFGNIATGFAGIVTVDVSLGTGSAVKFTNKSGSGSAAYPSPNKLRYTWPAGDLGLVTLLVRSDIAQTVNIRVRSTAGLVDDNSEGNLIFASALPPPVMAQLSPSP